MNYKNKQFKTIDGDTHRIDKTGNHFRNNRCVNPVNKRDFVEVEGVFVQAEIGDTYPDEADIVKDSIIEL